MENSNTNNPIDLRGVASDVAPLEKKYKPLLWASILCIPVLILMIICGVLFYAFVMEYSTDLLFFGLLFVEIPFFLLSICFLLHAKKKHKKSQTQRKMQKGATTILYIITIFTVSLTMVCGFANAFSTAGILQAFLRFFFIAMCIVLVLYCNAISMQNGTEAYLCFAKALMLGFLLAAPVGYVLGMILRALEYMLIVFIILIIAFFMCGGNILFIRRD